MSDSKALEVLSLILENQKALLAETAAIRELLANELIKRLESHEFPREALKNACFVRVIQKET